MALPHIKNNTAGINKWEPIWTSLFQVYFTVPASLAGIYTTDEIMQLSQEVNSIEGLDALNRMPEKKDQKFMGVTRTYMQPKPADTSAEITVKLNLNLRNKVDNIFYKIFHSWGQLVYNMETGETSIKDDICADYLRVAVHNKKGDIIRDIYFRDIMLTKVEDQMNSLDANTPDGVAELSLTFASDYWDDAMA